ncbi:hypothetical protein M0R45_023948 [Rubus argutus]|uniref:C3H1-type domain-containing protein n=1 Tax=Rubus argutus TaxID=59490 RepID=A0AAW1WPN2_RUBAR
MELSESTDSVPPNSNSNSDNNEIDQVQQQLHYSEIGSHHSIPETNDIGHQQQNHSGDLGVLHSSPDPDAAAPSDLDHAVVDQIQKLDLKGDDVEVVVEEKKEKGEDDREEEGGELQEVEAEKSYNGRETENGNESERHSEVGEEESNEGEDKSENGADVERRRVGRREIVSSGSNCKFNHPVRRKNNPGFKDKVKERDDLAEKPGQTECKYYLRPGGCKYGKACRYNHGKGKPSVASVVELNFLGLPIRQGERECPYYMRNGSCKYGSNCRFNHPDPTAAGGSEPSIWI